MKTRKTYCWLMAGICALLFASCSSTSTGYIPQHAQVPLLESRGDVQVTAGMSDGVLADATLSAALTDHWAAQVHLSGQPLQNMPGTYSLGVGNYHRLGPVVFEAWAGMEQGMVSNRAPFTYEVEWARSTTGRYVLPYVQLDAGLRDLTPLHLDVGLALRGGVMKPSFRTSQWDETGNVTYSRSYGAGTVLLEPQLLVRIGWRDVKCSLQAGWTLPWSRVVGDMDYEPFSLMIGVAFLLHGEDN